MGFGRKLGRGGWVQMDAGSRWGAGEGMGWGGGGREGVGVVPQSGGLLVSCCGLFTFPWGVLPWAVLRS